eukprot:UN27550
MKNSGEIRQLPDDRWEAVRPTNNGELLKHKVFNNYEDAIRYLKYENQVVDVTPEQYRQYLLRIGVPFFAFGAMDNGLMIICGEFIDTHLTHAMGFSVMFSAAAGNIVADVTGVGFGDFIERCLTQIGLKDPKLTIKQLQFTKVRRGRTISSLVGIALGCVLE